MRSTEAAPSGALGIYMHIPFCSAICNYCNFNRGLFDGALKQRYVAALVAEIGRAGDGAQVDSIFFGGGTPSLLDASEVAQILDACRSAFAVAEGVETTLEMNPESCSGSHVHGLLDVGITRVSLGVQSFHDHELVRLGRTHTADQARTAITTLRDAGCTNLSLDLMLWLPGQSRTDCVASVDEMVALSPDHASLYMLELYPNAPLREEMARSGWSLAPDEDAAGMYLDALERTDRAGYEQYEISNVSRPGRRSRHNLKYWRDGNWLGFGCGAHSTRVGVRWKNCSETVRYIETIECGESPAEGRRRLPADERLGDAVFTGLRLVEGVDVDALGRRYHTDLRGRFGRKLRPYVEAGVLVDADGRWRLTRAGMLVSNEVMKDFV